MLRRREVYVNITPLPSSVPRQLALDILHSHSEIITLNPLVLSHNPVKAPRDAPADEYYCTWYEINQRVQYIPGLGKMGSGKISFKGCFHDVTWGLQTHTYAPMNVDMKCNYRIEGSQERGLQLKEEIEIECNRTMISFVKKEMKAASKVLVDRLIKKAELLDAGVLQAMIEDGRLKTFNPADRSSMNRSNSIMSQPSSMRFSTGPMSPGRMDSVSSGAGSVRSSATQVPTWRRESDAGMPVELPGNYYHPQRHSQHSSSDKYQDVAELDTGVSIPSPQPDKVFRAELSSMPESADEYAAYNRYTPYRRV